MSRTKQAERLYIPALKLGVAAHFISAKQRRTIPTEGLEALRNHVVEVVRLLDEEIERTASEEPDES